MKRRLVSRATQNVARIQRAQFARRLLLAAGPASFALVGTAATLVKSRRIAAAPASYALTGQPATLMRGKRLTAGAATFGLSGAAATLRRSLRVAGAAGSFALTGTAATLVKSGGTPTIVTTDSYNSAGSSVDPIPVPLPASIVSGNKLVVIVATGGAAVLTTPGGWSLLGVFGTTGSFDRRIRVYERIADGSEGATLNIDQTASNSVSSAFSIQVAGSASATLIAGTDGTGVDPDPPNNNPGTSAATLWISACSKRQTSAISAAPSGYSLIEVAEWSSNMSAAAASKVSTASSEDPGVFTGTGSDKWAAVTLGFRA